MLHIVANRTFRRLFTAQVIALMGTGLLTIVLALLSWDLAGPDAGVVLGTALAIKMIAYVGLAPVAGAGGKPRGLGPASALRVERGSQGGLRLT